MRQSTSITGCVRLLVCRSTRRTLLAYLALFLWSLASLLLPKWSSYLPHATGVVVYAALFIIIFTLTFIPVFIFYTQSDTSPTRHLPGDQDKKHMWFAVLSRARNSSNRLIFSAVSCESYNMFFLSLARIHLFVVMDLSTRSKTRTGSQPIVSVPKNICNFYDNCILIPLFWNGKLYSKIKGVSF